MLSETSSGTARAAALQAAGMLLSRDDPFVLARLGMQSNYTVLPAWFVDPMRTTL